MSDISGTDMINNEEDNLPKEAPPVYKEEIITDSEIPLDESEPLSEQPEQINKETTDTIKPKTKRIKQNVETVKKVLYPSDKPLEDNEDYICLPSDFIENIEANITDSDKINLEDSEDKKEWARALRDSLDHIVSNKVFQSALIDVMNDFTNKFTYGNSELGNKTPKLSSSNATGEKAVIVAAQELGLGTLKNIPLFNSGFHLILKPYTNIELVELNIKISENKISLGSQTKGLVYSSTTYYAIECVIEFIKNHIYNSSLKLESGEDYMDYIASQDIADLIWGILLVSNPSGFNYKRACTVDPANCNIVESGILKLSEAQYINRNALNEAQKIAMSRIDNRSKTKEEVLRYQKELVCMSEKRVPLIESKQLKVNVILKAPTVNEYINSSRTWVMQISDKINQIFSTSSENDRDRFILDAGKSTSIRQYCHYISQIEEIRYDGDEEVVKIISDRETIEKYISFIGDNVEVLNKFFDAVTDYISKSTVTVIGIPVYNCSACEKPQTQETSVYDPVFSEIIPVDMLTYFFSHLTQKIAKIRQF